MWVTVYYVIHSKYRSCSYESGCYSSGSWRLLSYESLTISVANSQWCISSAIPNTRLYMIVEVRKMYNLVISTVWKEKSFKLLLKLVDTLIYLHGIFIAFCWWWWEVMRSGKVPTIPAGWFIYFILWRFVKVKDETHKSEQQHQKLPSRHESGVRKGRSHCWRLQV